MGFKPQNMPWGGFHAQQAPNTKIVTCPRVTLSARRSLCRVPPTMLKLLQGQQCTDLLPTKSTACVVLRPLCRKCFSTSMCVSPTCVWCCLKCLLWWWRPCWSKAERTPSGLLPCVVSCPPVLSALWPVSSVPASEWGPLFMQFLWHCHISVRVLAPMSLSAGCWGPSVDLGGPQMILPTCWCSVVLHCQFHPIPLW